jgi:hypothetical protein
MISPGDFTRVFAFLIAFGSTHDPIFQEKGYGFLRLFDMNFAFQCRMSDLSALARGISTSLAAQGNNPRTPKTYFDQIMDFCSLLEDTVSYRLLGSHGEEMSTNDLIAISKLHLTIKRAFGDSPFFQESVSRWTEGVSPASLDSKLCREMALTLLSANWNAPPVFELIQSFILKNPGSVTADLAGKFLSFVYASGYEGEEPKDSQSFQTCYNVLERYAMELEVLVPCGGVDKVNFIYSNNIFQNAKFKRLNRE